MYPYELNSVHFNNWVFYSINIRETLLLMLPEEHCLYHFSLLM